MSDTSSKVGNVEAGAPDPVAVASESKVQENADKCKGEQSQSADKCKGEQFQSADKCKGEQSQSAEKCEGEHPQNAATVLEKVDPVIEKSEDSANIVTDVKEQAAAPNEENVECVSFAKEWEKMYTAVKQPSAPSTSEVRQPERRAVGNVQVALPRPAQRPPPRPQQRPGPCCPPVFYWKAILAFTVVMLATGFLIYAHRYLYASPTKEDLKHNAYVALACGSLAAFLGLVGCYLWLRTVNIFWCCQEFLRRHLRSAQDNNPYRVVAFHGRGDIESQITEAEMDIGNPETERSGESKSVSPKETGEGQRMSTDKDAIFSSPISDDKSSKMSEVASAVTSIVSETLKEGDKEQLTDSSDSKEGSVEVSTSSTETSSETLMESGEIRRRKIGSSGQSSATQSSDEDSTKKD